MEEEDAFGDFMDVEGGGIEDSEGLEGVEAIEGCEESDGAPPVMDDEVEFFNIEMVEEKMEVFGMLGEGVEGGVLGL